MLQNEIYKLKHYFGEPTKTALYGVSFNQYDQKEDAVFAVVGGRNVIIGHFENNKTVALNILQTYVDENETENYYCCAWSFDPNTGAPWLAVAGSTGLVKIINTSLGHIAQTLTGHGDANFSIRLWNVITSTPIVIFGGECGHREPDVHLSGDFLVSSGMDHAVKIWSLCTPVIKNTIESSFKAKPPSSLRNQQNQTQSCCKSNGYTSTPLFIHFPIFSTAQLHNNYVDCVRWYGDLLMSRCAADAKILLWKPDVELVASDKSTVTTTIVGGPAQPTSFEMICEFEFEQCDIWFLRFGISQDYKFLATGNQVGQIFLWDLQEIPYFINSYIEKKKLKSTGIKMDKTVNNGENIDKKICKPAVLDVDICDSTIRQVAFSKNRQWMITVCDDATVWGWKLNREISGQQAGSKMK
ncbi:6252_t:CDS:2 [Diversispora eburnea]|uniref:6252_t:CDS:1 n=1 Tax=Diversispora eburnea TaxID=1213867 RepID=A0A9N9A938_9GLOM|nr:6252_t:CDS:2 [Diversispora eburnea]